MAQAQKGSYFQLVILSIQFFVVLFIAFSFTRTPTITAFLTGLLVFLIFFFNTKAGIFLYTGYLAFEETILQHIPSSLYIIAKYSGDFFLVLLLLAVFTKLATRRYTLEPIKNNPFNKALIIFLILGIFSMVINEVPLIVGAAGLRQLMRYIVLYLLVLIISNSAEEWTVETTKSLLKLFLVLVGVQVFIGYLQLIYGPGSALNYFLAPGKAIYYEGIAVGSAYSTAAKAGLYGTFLTRNIYGLFLMSGFIICLGLLHEIKVKNVKTFIFCMILVLIPCVIQSYSRAAIMAALGGLLIITIVKGNYKIATLVGVGMIGVSVYAFGYITPTAYIEPEAVTVGQRLASSFRQPYIRKSLKSARLAVVNEFTPRFVRSKYVVFGLGPGSFGTPVGTSLGYFGGYEKLGVNVKDPRLYKLIYLTADVGYLALFVQYGTLGIAAFLWIFVSLFKTLRQKYLVIEDEFFKGYLLGFLAYIVVFAFTWIGGLNIEVRQISYYFWMIAALLISLPTTKAAVAATETPVTKKVED